MRKIMRVMIVFVLLLCILTFSTLDISALDNTTYTYTVSVDDEWVRTQDAYIPAAIFAKEIGLSQPSDLFYKSGKLYISDTGNSRIVVYSIEDSSAEFFGGEELSAPNGLFVTENGNIYVADTQAQAVFVYDSNYKLIQKIGRPNSNLFSETSLYRPTAVAVSSVGNIFVVGEGAYEGIMQFDSKGEFYGYFAANTYKMSMYERFQELIYNEEQKDSLFVRTPRPIDNIDISSKDLIFSVTQSDERTGFSYASTSDDALKMHNMTGLNIFSKKGQMKEEWNFTDVASGQYGNVFCITQTGIINEYDSQGNLIFTFGGRAYNNDRNGLFTNAVAIDIDESGVIYALDSDRTLVQVFYPTDFANLTHQAIATLENGDYETSEKIWGSLLRLNGMSQLAHNGYGKALFYQQKFNDALYHFEIANNTQYYSDAFWEIRNEWLSNNMKYILSFFIVLVVLSIAYSIIKRKYKLPALADRISLPRDNKFGRFFGNVVYVRKMLSHPLDGYYYLRRGERGSVGVASLLYVLAFVVYVLDLFGRGYIFSSMNFDSANPVSIVIMFCIPLILWLAGNYLIGTINEGEGSVKQIYVSTAYAFAPYIILAPLNIILSHCLTLNEGFVVNLGSVFIILWSACLFFLSVKEIHKYTFGETVKSIFLVFFFMIMVIVAFAIIYLLFSQIVSFVKEILEEAVYRAAQ